MTPVGGRGTQIRVLRDWDGFDALREPWNELVEHSGAPPFVSHRWLSTWRDAFASGSAPRVIQVWRDGMLVGAAPLALSARKVGPPPRLLRTLCLSAMSNNETPFWQLLVAPGHGDAVEEILRAIADKRVECGMCELEHLRQDDALTALRDAASRLRLRPIWCETARSVTVDLSDGWEAYLSRRSSNFRRKLRRERRTLEKADHAWARGDSGEPELLERAAAVSRSSWKGKSGTSFASSPDTMRFYRDLWRSFGSAGLMELTVLAIEGRDAGIFMSIKDGDIAYAMKTDFVEDFAGYSPGRILTADFLERSAKSGVRQADLLRYSPFTAEFSDGGYTLGRFRAFPQRNAAALWFALEELLRPI